MQAKRRSGLAGTGCVKGCGYKSKVTSCMMTHSHHGRHVTTLGKLLILSVAGAGLIICANILPMTSYETKQMTGAFWSGVKTSSRKITGSGTLSLDIQGYVKGKRAVRMQGSEHVNISNNNHSNKNKTTNNNSNNNSNNNNNDVKCAGIQMCDSVPKSTDDSRLCQREDQYLSEQAVYMTISKSMGRMGNHMFQYASLLGTARRHGHVPYVKPDFPLKRWFNLPYTCNISISNALKFNETLSNTYNTNIENLNENRNYTINGFFQSWKYFNDIGGIIKRAFTVKNVYFQPAKKFMKNITVSGRHNVCVHVRRGDLKSSVSRHRGFVIAHLGYIVKAMNYFRYKVGHVQFIVLSDDMTWCQENILASDVIFSPFYDGATDMALMTLCDHVILTSGTFGWWGAWLAGGTTVYFNGYPATRSWLATQFNRADYYMPNWIGLD